MTRPPARPAPPARDRLAGLGPSARRLMQQAAGQLQQGALAAAGASLTLALKDAPSHPEVLRLLALVRYRTGGLQEAIDLLQRAQQGWPDDAIVLSTLGGLLGNVGRTDEALALLRRACEIEPELAAAWFNLGRLLDAEARHEEAGVALRKAIECDPAQVSARVLEAGTRAAVGDIAGAAEGYRTAIAQQPASAQAWLGLVNLKTIRLEAAESARLERLHATPGLSEPDRMTLAFALGQVLEDQQRPAEAFSVLGQANAAMRRRLPWDRAGFTREIEAIAAAFSGIPVSSPDASAGREVIFLVSLPRSGSTLAEQILAAHPRVEGASELPDLEAVVAEESARRRQPFARWAAEAEPADWRRLGERYLERTRRWRERRERFTDKMPDNWRLAGAAMAMLPGARIVNCRRDALETCWSCFKQLFGPGRQGQSYAFDDLAAHWHDYDRLSRHWQARAPHRFAEFAYEDLLADPEASVRRLLAACDLPFDPACLSFHTAHRAVRSASAAQVREPLRRDTRRSDLYGALLDPLRQALARRSPAPT